MTKEEKIKEAYGENYNPHNIDENGWMKYSLWMHFFKKVDADYDEFDNRNMVVRPNSLIGIENNNCWIKIESENDLPKIGTYDMRKFKLMYWPNGGQYEANDYKKWVLHYSHLEITHYQFIPIIKLNEPLY